LKNSPVEEKFYYHFYPDQYFTRGYNLYPVELDYHDGGKQGRRTSPQAG
jgi:hypothetical protein